MQSTCIAHFFHVSDIYRYLIGISILSYPLS